MPFLERIVVQDFRNIELQELEFSRKLNCITGGNGEGKTNLLDAIWYLSMTKSAFTADRFNLRYGAESFAMSGTYSLGDGRSTRISIRVGEEKTVRRDDKPYARISEHIGLLPIVMVSPSDVSMVSDSGDERRRFASELHDGLGPLLSSVKMGVSAISEDIQDAEIRKNLEDAVNEAITTTREISNNISPHILSNFGIESAVKRFVSSISLSNNNINFTLNISIKDKRYPETIEVVAYRVICELINNTIRHAKAQNINLSIADVNGILNINYADDGIGFDSDNVLKYSKHGMGYYNMVSRVTSLKGTIDFSNVNNKGMSASIKIPTYDF